MGSRDTVNDRARIRIAHESAERRGHWGRMLSERGYLIEEAADSAELLDGLADPPDVALVGSVLPPAGGIAALEELKREQPSIPVAVVGPSTPDSILAAFRGGAFDFVEEPVDAGRLHDAVGKALDRLRLGAARKRLARDLEDERRKVRDLERQLSPEDAFRNIVGGSALVRSLLETLREVARTDSTVLLMGESGTGKGLLARAIHEASPRRVGPFVEANCVVYSEGVLHSELFGHERGAFTGAARLKKGRFELATGGTIFLDEIGEIAPSTQLLLLRVLQERNFERVGGEETVEVDVRLIAATNRDLAEAMRQGTFRSDLFYRLNVIPVHVPPLREHPDDVPLLAQHFVEACAPRLGRRIEGFTPEALDALAHYPWPGNIRELENLVERLVVLCRGDRIGAPDLPAAIRAPEERTGPTPGTLEDMERRRIVEVLHDTSGNKKAAAQKLGIHRSTLYAKLRRYGLLDEGEAKEAPAERELAGARG